MNNKFYEKVVLLNNPDIFTGYLRIDDEVYLIPEELLKKICRDIGFSLDWFDQLYNLDENIGSKFITTMCERSHHSDVLFLLEKEKGKILGYSWNLDRLPILNNDFIKLVNRAISSSDYMSITECYHVEEDIESTVLIKKNEPIIIEENYLNGTITTHPYTVGILIKNNEVDSVSTRLIMYLKDQPIYLPLPMYNATSSRYKRSTSTSEEALELLLLKVAEDLRENNLADRIDPIHYQWKLNKDLPATYQEYKGIHNFLLRLAASYELENKIYSLDKLREDFEDQYPILESRESSYLWRCTARGSVSIGDLVNATLDSMDLTGDPKDYDHIREVLGEYISTDRIVKEIAEVKKS